MIRVKICGVATPEDALAAAGVGADYVGLNFYPRSPRFLTTDRAKEILSVLPPSVRAVGLFVETPWNEIASVAGEIGLNLIQTYSEKLPTLAECSFEYIPAFRIKDRSSIESIHEALRTAERPPHAIIIDAHVPGSFGGTGHLAPWELLEGFSPGVPWFLAGGLTPGNVAEAVKRLRPDGVDVSSGVESSPGRKDPIMMREFVRAARES